MINPAKNTEYRHCVDGEIGNCPYMYINEYGTACCSIDKICQVEWYGCRPIDVINKRNKGEKQ